MTFLIDPPVERVLPVTKGADRAFTVQRVDSNGDPVDYPAGSVVTFWLDADIPASVDATVAGPNASFVIPSTVLDEGRAGTKWRIIWTQGDDDTAMMVGRLRRYDG